MNLRTKPFPVLLTLVLVLVLAWAGLAGSPSIRADGPAVGARLYLPLNLRAGAPQPAPPPEPTPSPATTASLAPTATATSEPPATPADPIAPDFAPFGLAQVEPELRLDGSGVTVDSLAFWEAPRAEDTLLLATAKGNGRVEVWQWPFQGPELAALEHPSFKGASVNGIAVDQDLGRAYVSVARPSSTIAVFTLPGLEPLSPLVTGGQVDLRTEPNLTLLRLPDGGRRLFVTADERVYVFDPVDGSAQGSFPTTHAMENLVADDLAQALYIPDETSRKGVFAYRPDGRPFQRGGQSGFGGDGTFEADAEGIALYACRGAEGQDDGRGVIIVSDQKGDATDFEVFDRRSWVHLGRLQVAGVRLTDGVATSSRPLPGHPQGLFAAVNNDLEIVLLGWERIAAAAGLRCEAPLPH